MNNRKEVKTVSFKGQVFSIGLDVHRKNWSVSIVKGGMMLKTYSIEANVLALLSLLNKKYPDGEFEFCYEAGFSGFWLQRELTEAGYKCIVVNPADIPSTQKEKVTKSDTVDSRKLARELHNKQLYAIYVPCVEEEAYRDIYRYRVATVKKQTAVKNQIKSFLNKYGIEVGKDFEGKKWTKKFIKWLGGVRFSHKYSRIAFDNYLEDLDYISTKVINITKELSSLLKANKYTCNIHRILRSNPGIGVACSIALVAEIWDMNRFKNDDSFCCYLGLIPMTKNTGDKEYSMGITFRHKKKLRWMIIESSWVAIREDPALLLRYEELKKRMSGNKAIIRIAKKLVRRIRHLWLNNEEYVKGVA